MVTSILSDILFSSLENGLYILSYYVIIKQIVCQGVGLVLLNIDTIHDSGNHRVKDKEKARIFKYICAGDISTRKSVTADLGLRPITVSKIVKELIEDGLVVEGERIARSGKGRPEVELFPDFLKLTAVSFTVVSREVRGFLLNLNGEILESISASIPGDAGNGEIAAEIGKLADTLTASVPKGSGLAGIGASLPGTVNLNEGIWISSSRWPEMGNLSLSKVLSEYGVPLFLYRSLDPELEYLLFRNSEYRKGGTLLFHWGYGIGSAYSYGGQVLTSSLGRFGEVGHWQVEPDSGKRCSCGSYGCLETEAALWAILPEMRKVYPDAPEDEAGFTAFIRTLDITSMDVMKKALGYVTGSLGNLYKIFYPDRIILIGPFTGNPYILKKLKDAFTLHIPEYARPSIDFKVVTENNGAVLGNVYHLFRKALKPLLETRINV